MSSRKGPSKATPKRAGHPLDEDHEEKVASVQVSVQPESPDAGEKLSKLVAALDKTTVENDALNQAVTEELWPALQPLPRSVQQWCEAAVALAMGIRDPSTVEGWRNIYKIIIRCLLPAERQAEIDAQVASLVRVASDDDHDALRAGTDALLKSMGELSFAITDAQTEKKGAGQGSEGEQDALTEEPCCCAVTSEGKRPLTPEELEALEQDRSVALLVVDCAVKRAPGKRRGKVKLTPSENGLLLFFAERCHAWHEPSEGHRGGADNAPDMLKRLRKKIDPGKHWFKYQPPAPGHPVMWSFSPPEGARFAVITRAKP